jgi:hypothetical protein
MLVTALAEEQKGDFIISKPTQCESRVKTEIFSVTFSLEFAIPTRAIRDKGQLLIEISPPGLGIPILAFSRGKFVVS